MTDERKKQLMESVGLPDSHSIKALIEQVENETMQTKPEVSAIYLQQVNTEMLVADIRLALERALKDNMQFATAVGVLQFFVTETIENAKAEVDSGHINQSI